MEEEIWKDIQDYENYYQVSTFSRVKSLKRTILKRDGILLPLPEIILKPGHTKGNNCMSVVLRKDNKSRTFTIQRLVAAAFIPNPENKPQVNHKNGIRTDNSLSNLEWVTDSENKIHAYKTGLKKPYKVYGIDNKKSIPVVQLNLNNEFIKDWCSAIEVERQLGFHHTHVGDCCRGKQKTCCGVWHSENTRQRTQ